MNEPIPGIVLRVDGQTFELIELSEYGFTIPGSFDGVEINPVNPATLEFTNGEPIAIEFRVRRNGGSTKAGFWKLSIRSREKIRKFNAERSRIASGNETLENRSYDELAAGLVGSGQRTSSVSAAGEGNDSTDAEATRPPVASGGFKSLAAILLLFGMLGIVVLAVAFLKSRNSLDVTHSALVGNFVPINARVAGEVSEVFFVEGADVKKGDVLMRLSNPDIEFNYRHFAAQRDAAAAKVMALEIELEGYGTKLEIAAQKLDLDMKVARSELAHAQKIESMYRSALERLNPGRRNGSVTQLEYNEVDAQLAAATAQVDAHRMQMESIKLARSAIKSEVLILGDRVNDEMGRIRSDLAVAKAEFEQFNTLADLAEQQATQLEIRAPRDGQIHACYRQKGEFLKVADEALAISYPGRVWASGHVTAEQASRVRPGQRVMITVPAMHLNLEGTVSAVGHRSVYSKGNYSAEFRGTTATDVPIKVQLVDLPDGVPAGIRLDMSITTGFGVKWIDEIMGNTQEESEDATKPNPLEVSPAGSGQEAIAENNDLNNHSDEFESEISLASAISEIQPGEFETEELVAGGIVVQGEVVPADHSVNTDVVNTKKDRTDER